MVDSFAYWQHSREFVGGIDLLAGVFKSFFFGAAIALISCHRGFHSRAGAEGVGRAATEAFVFSFIAILFLDFRIGIAWNSVYSDHLASIGGPAMSAAAAACRGRIRRGPIIELIDLSMRFRQQAVLREHHPADPPRRDRSASSARAAAARRCCSS